MKEKTVAYLLTGKELEEGWRVIKRIDRDPRKNSGGQFSVGYIVENEDGRRAFLKAIDLSPAFNSDDMLLALEKITRAFNFERSLLDICFERRMSRVVTAIGSGTINIPEAEGHPVTQYLIFELAEGDLRSQVDLSRRYETAWRLRALHHIATGLNQLHNAGIYHQDLKPSNVLVFRANGSKVSDLGRAISENIEAPHEDYIIAGDRRYAPPELLYQYLIADMKNRRHACDMYLMGSMVCFMFTGVQFTALLFHYLRDEHLPSKWGGAYHGVLPYLRDAFGFAIDHLASSVEEPYRAAVKTLVQQLCDPDPELRGHPTARLYRGNSYSLERYISQFDLLAMRAQMARH